MNVSATQQNYTNYQTQSVNSTSKTQANNFAKSMQDIEATKNESTSKENDLLDIQAFRNMSKEEKTEVHLKLIEKYGKEKGESYSFALYNSSNLSDENMQNAMFNELSNISKNDGLTFMLDFQISISRYAEGEQLQAGYSVIIDNNGESYNGDSDFNIKNYLSNISSDEFNYIFSTLFESHKSLEKVVGEQATWFANIYDDILNSYYSYKDDENNSYQPYA